MKKKIYIFLRGTHFCRLGNLGVFRRGGSRPPGTNKNTHRNTVLIHNNCVGLSITKGGVVRPPFVIHKVLIIN